MAVKVDIDIKKSFDVEAPIDKVFALLADVKESASHFPKVDQLVDLGDNTFRWELEKVGFDKHAIQTIYACKYASDPESGTVTWKPVHGIGNGETEGEWRVQENEDGTTHVTFATSGYLELPAPKLLKLAITPVVNREFNSQVDKYIRNLTAALED